MNAAIARVILRYVVGGVFMGSVVVGDKLALDPDVVELVALGVGAAVEGFYVLAKRNGWSL